MLKKKRNHFKNSRFNVGVIALAVVLIFSCFSYLDVAAAEGMVHELIIMGTSDIHAHIMPYDYMGDKVDEKIGLSKAATLVDQIRAKHPNTLLLDAGDTIQGSILGDLDAIVKPIKKGESHSVIGSMNLMGYDAAVVGNHEFNFGLEFLDTAYNTAKFPLVNANVYKAGTEENYFTPYVIIDKIIDGKKIKIGVIGFVPPQIMIWDKLNLEGKVYTKGIVETAEKFVPIMKEQGAELIIAVAHTGIDAKEGAAENAAYHLSKVKGIDAMVLGHQHNQFPHANYSNIEGIDIEKGLINGVPAVMPGSWGSHLGLIQLQLINKNGGWEVVSGKSEVFAVEAVTAKGNIVDFVKAKHTATVEYINNFVGKTKESLNTFFARVTDGKVVKLINDAQIWFATNFFKGTEYENMPLLSAAAPFRAGRHGADYFTNVEAGGIAIKDVADIYLYPNTLQVVKVNSEELIKWLEKSAENFKQIDPSKTEDQVLLDYNYRGYNYDVIEGIHYQIDITKPVGKRIVNVTYKGKPLTIGMEFLVVTNNYRASGGGNHLQNAEVILSATEENRGVIIDYIREKGEAAPTLSNNWSILPVETAGKVVFRSSPLAIDYIKEEGITNITHVRNEDAWAIYAIDISKPNNKEYTFNTSKNENATGKDMFILERNNKVYLPLRSIVEGLNGKAIWDGNTLAISISLDGKSVLLKLNSNEVIIDGTSKSIEETPIVVKGRTLITLEQLKTILGYDVKYDAKSQTVTIIK